MKPRHGLAGLIVLLPLAVVACQRGDTTPTSEPSPRNVALPSSSPKQPETTSPTLVVPVPTAGEGAAVRAIHDVNGDAEGSPVTAVRLTGKSITNGTLKHLQAFPQLETLTIHAAITDAGLKELKGLKTLQSLDLADSPITDAGLKELKDLTALKTLDLSGTKITDMGLRELKDFSNLRSLGLSGCEGVTDAGLAALAECKNLKRVQLANTRATAAGMGQLKKVLPEVEFD